MPFPQTAPRLALPALCRVRSITGLWGPLVLCSEGGRGWVAGHRAAMLRTGHEPDLIQLSVLPE